MIRKLDLQAVSNILFEVDPMNTGCKENQLFDEYDSEAHMIIQQVEHGADVGHAVIDVFNHCFWDGCLDQRADRVETIVSDIMLFG